MATLIPETPKDCTRSERVVYQRLGDELDREWVILHSLGLVDHGSKRRGEADIVVLSTRGIFVLEVKGGHVSCRDGRWYFGTPGGQEVERKEDPWSQASGSMFAVIRRVKAEAPDLEGLLYGFGVVMPMERFTSKGMEIDAEVLLDNRDFGRNLSFYIGDLERRWRQIYAERGLREPRRPTVEDVKRVRKILRPDIESAFSLGSWLNGLEQELLQLTNEQIRISRRLAANPRMIVTGKAGTGKTVLAVQRALLLAERGMSVLYLCFNQLLARHVTDTVKGLPGAGMITVRHLHDHYHKAICAAGLQDRLPSAEGDEKYIFGVLFPQLYIEGLMETEPTLFDAVVVDEAQDILTPEHLDALDLTVDGGLESGRWHLFLDPQQNIYGAMSVQAEQRLERVSIARDELVDNCRNTREVAYQTSILSTLDVAVEGAPTGPSCECRFYGTPADGISRINSELMELFKRDVKPSDIIILSTRRRENSILSDTTDLAGLPLRDIADGPSAKTIAFSTMHGFKGLERSVVVAIDLAEIGQSEWAMLHYAGLSRARTLLLPFIPRNCEQRYKELVAAFGRRISRG
jgi:Nuclease-related domain/PhoH-like protein